jgi:hypothetical protein
VIRFCCYTLVAIVALIGPRWMGLVGEASASYRAIAIDRQDLTADLADTPKSQAVADSAATPSDPVPSKPEIRLVDNLPAGYGAGSPASSNQNVSPGGTPGAMSEAESPMLPFVTRLRLAQERMATISSPSSVFEPPRAG